MFFKVSTIETKYHQDRWHLMSALVRLSSWATRHFFPCPWFVTENRLKSDRESVVDVHQMTRPTVIVIIYISKNIIVRITTYAVKSAERVSREQQHGVCTQPWTRSLDTSCAGQGSATNLSGWSSAGPYIRGLQCIDLCSMVSAYVEATPREG